MKEIILNLTVGVTTLGLALTLAFASIVIIKEGREDRDFFGVVLGLLLLFCAAIPALGLFASLFFIQ